MKKYTELSHAHFQNRLWRNELEMMQKETDFFLGIAEELNIPHEMPQKTEQNWFFNQFHHFQRMTKQLLDELAGIEKALAEGVLEDNILNKELRLDNGYFKEQMDYLEQDYRQVKNKFRAFIAASDTIGID